MSVTSVSVASVSGTWGSPSPVYVGRALVTGRYFSSSPVVLSQAALSRVQVTVGSDVY